MSEELDLDAGSAATETWTLLRTLFGRQRRRFLIAASELALHPAQAGALLQLASPVPMNELAARLGCDNSNVTGLIDRLEARELVTRQAGFHDRRVKHVVLTDRGRRLREQLLERVRQPTPGFDRLSTAEQRQLASLLRRVLAGEADSSADVEDSSADVEGSSVHPADSSADGEDASVHAEPSTLV